MTDLPPGQRESSSFHRFGLTPFATRFPSETKRQTIRISGAVAKELEIERPLEGMERVTQTSNFHCVTTWSVLGLNWGGVRFCDFYEQVLLPMVEPDGDATTVALRAQDGARTGMLLSDMLDTSVMLVDRLNGEPLSLDHGAPLRLIAPKHYGYKSVKHLSELRFLQPGDNYRATGFEFMDHPRARVDFEERGRVIPGSLLRYAYRPLVRGTARKFADASMRRQAAQKKESSE